MRRAGVSAQHVLAADDSLDDWASANVKRHKLIVKMFCHNSGLEGEQLLRGNKDADLRVLQAVDRPTEPEAYDGQPNYYHGKARTAVAEMRKSTSISSRDANVLRAHEASHTIRAAAAASCLGCKYRLMYVEKRGEAPTRTMYAFDAHNDAYREMAASGRSYQPLHPEVMLWVDARARDGWTAMRILDACHRTPTVTATLGAKDVGEAVRSCSAWQHVRATAQTRRRQCGRGPSSRSRLERRWRLAELGGAARGGGIARPAAAPPLQDAVG